MYLLYNRLHNSHKRIHHEGHHGIHQAMLVLVASHEMIVGMTTVDVTMVAVTTVAVTQVIGVMIATDVVKVNVMVTVMTVNGEMTMSVVTATEERCVTSADRICSHLQK